MIAILAESYAGKWPFWLSPRQCIVIPVGAPFNDYAFKVYKSINVKVFLTNLKQEKNIFDVGNVLP
jgi:threonyl-tRNA synthetase